MDSELNDDRFGLFSQHQGAGSAGESMARLAASAALPKSMAQLAASAAFANNILARHADAFTAASTYGLGVNPPPVLTGYEEAARRVLETLDAHVDEPMPFTPPNDDSAYEALANIDRELADAIDDAAGIVKTSFWSRRAVRNSLAWLVVTLIVTAWVAGAFLPAPLGALLAGLYGTGQAVVQARKQAGSSAPAGVDR